MMVTRLLCIICFLLTLTGFAYAQSNWPLSRIQNNSLYDVQYVTPEIAYAAGAYGTIIKTTDAGEHWTPQASGTTSTLNSIFFLNPETGYAAGDSGIILKTINGGTAWTRLFIPYSNILSSVWFVNTDTGFAVGTDPDIIRTTDGGQTWTAFSMDGSLHDVAFINSSNGIAVGEIFTDGDYYGCIYTTSDGGNTWVYQESSNPLYTVFYIDSSNVTAAGQFILRSTNGGSTWSGQPMPGNIYDICFADSSNGFAVGETFAGIHKTTDGGSTWITIPDISTQNITAISSSSPGSFTVTGEYGVILKSTDSGESWISQSKLTESDLMEVRFLNTLVGVAGGSNGNIIYTTDGGDSWSLTVTDLYYISALELLTPNVWIAAGETGSGFKFIKTTDGGSTWNDLYTTDDAIWDMKFLNSRKGTAVGHFDLILKTSDGGESWTHQPSGTSNAIFHKIFYTEQSVGYISGSSGTILKTTDGGDNWSNISTGADEFYTAVYFTDAQHGVIAGGAYNEQSGRILRTTDGGITWTRTNFGQNAFNDIVFSSSARGLLAGDNGTLLRTTNAGASWTITNSGTINNLYSTALANTNTAFIVGQGGTIIKSKFDRVRVEIAHLHGAYHTDGAVITWISDPEGTFEIERRTGSGNWIRIGSAGFSQDGNYKFTDLLPGPGKYYYRLLKTSNDEYSEEIELNTTTLPVEFTLSQNYPNPFNPVTQIKYSVPSEGIVTIILFDLLGKEIKTLLNEEKSPGNYELTINASGLPSGIYFYQMNAIGFADTKKMMVIK